VLLNPFKLKKKEKNYIA